MSYRTRRFLRRFFTVLLTVLVIGALVWGCWMIWVQRHMIYTKDGVKIDFSRTAADLTGEEALPPVPGATVAIHYVDSAEFQDDTTDELTQILGYVVTTDALLHDFDAVQTQVEALPPGTAVMVDVKSIYGNFYYNTEIDEARTSESISASRMDALIKTMEERNLYAIARLPAFRDRNFGENNVSCGLAVSAGYLWTDEENCYWLDPTNSGTIGYLIGILNELKRIGFDEAVFTEFRYPDDVMGEIVYSTNQSEAEVLLEAATQLVSSCSDSNFAVSFQAGTGFEIPSGRSRLYVEGIAAEQAGSTAGSVHVDNPIVNLVFLATSNDTRYNAYCALRTMDVGQGIEYATGPAEDPDDGSQVEEETIPEETSEEDGEGDEYEEYE